MSFVVYCVLSFIVSLYYWTFTKLQREWEKGMVDRFMLKLGNLLVVTMYIYFCYVAYFYNLLTGRGFLLAVLTFITCHLIFIVYKQVHRLEQYTLFNLFILVLCFGIMYLEMPLYALDRFNVNVHVFHEPQLLGRTNIYVLSTHTVTTYRNNVNEEHPHIYEITNVENVELYEYNKKGLWNLQLFKNQQTFKESIEIAGALVAENTSSSSTHVENNTFPSTVLMDARTWTNTSGPSAGLAFYIASLIEQIGFLNDVPIAMTGAIDHEGNVLKVGGIKYKTLNALQTGIETIIVPTENKEEVLKVLKESETIMNVYGVSTAEEALQIIELINEKYPSNN